MNIPPKYEDVVAQLGEATDTIEYMRKERVRTEGREAALREELSKLADDYCKKVDDLIELQQRLTVAEQRASEMEGLLREWRHGRDITLLDCARLRNRTDAALKPAEEGEGS